MGSGIAGAAGPDGAISVAVSRRSAQSAKTSMVSTAAAGTAAEATAMVDKLVDYLEGG